LGTSIISVQHVPADNTYANGSFQSAPLLVTSRTTSR
jgi:hypothetical protein